MTDYKKSNAQETKFRLYQELKKRCLTAVAYKSAAWSSMVGITIGGSEQATIAGDNPYCKIPALVANKAGIVKRFDGNIFTRWGTLMEKCLSLVVSHILGCQIDEFGTVTGKAAFQRYSPDGIGFVKLPIGCKWFILLFEFKNPFNRIPNGLIPKEYLHQIRAGLSTLPELDGAIYADSMTRLCSYEDYGYNRHYNLHMHSKDKKDEVEVDKPIAMGTVIFYQTASQVARCASLMPEEKEEEVIIPEDDDPFCTIDVLPSVEGIEIKQTETLAPDIAYFLANNVASIDDRQKKLKITARSLNKMMDFGVEHRHISTLVKMVEQGFLTAYYVRPCIFRRQLSKIRFVRDMKLPCARDYTDKEWKKRLTRIFEKEDEALVRGVKRILEYDKDSRLVGLLRWKMFKITMVLREKTEEDVTYIDEYLPIMKDVIDRVEKIRSSPTPWKTFHEMYPNHMKAQVDDD